MWWTVILHKIGKDSHKLDSSHTGVHVALPLTRKDKLDLVDATGRIIREGKSGFIPSDVPPTIALWPKAAQMA